MLRKSNKKLLRRYPIAPLLLSGLTILANDHSAGSSSAHNQFVNDSTIAPTNLVHTVRPQGASGQTELVTITQRGFEPTEFTRPAGRFLFGINNRTQLSDLTFQLVNRAGVVLVEERVVRLRVWRKVLDLPAGRYVVGVVGHPEWRCTITISQ